MDRKDLNEVLYRKINCDGVRMKVAEIGTDPGNMPVSKCWWLKRNNIRMAEIEQIQCFANKLNPLAYPDEDEVLAIQRILNKWTLAGKIQSELICYDDNHEN